MKNITYGQSNEGAELIYTRAIRLDITFQTIKYAVAHAWNLRSNAEADDRASKCEALQDTFDKTTDMNAALRYQHK